MNAAEYQTIKQHIENASSIGFSHSFSLAKQCSQMLAIPETESFGRDLIIRILEHSRKVDAGTRRMWNDLVEASGLHPYVDRSLLGRSAAIRHEAHLSQSLPGVYLHSEQLKLSSLLEEGRSVIVSAPTSFGKSLLIEEIVASKRYNNIVIIQPTLALLDETRKKLEKYRQEYRLVVSTHQKPSPERNIFLFTGERVVDYREFPPIDFFVIDEFYKLSLERDDERAATLNQALYRLLKLTTRFYFLGPNIKSITPSFVNQHEATWHHSEYATVSVDVFRLHEGKNWKERDKRSKGEREASLFQLLPSLKEPTLIYCSSPDKATELADRFSSHLADGKLTPSDKRKFTNNSDMLEWINANIHGDWSLARSLKNGIGFHHSLVPRHLSSSIVDAFNQGNLRYLFCTATLIEGVNTKARNVVLFDKKKGQKPIDFFDYKNIVGRSGRMKEHFVGKVYEFHKEPSQLELDVDLPLFSQSNAPLELLVQLSREDVEQSERERMRVFDSLDEELKQIIRRNSGISVEGQIKLVEEIQTNAALYHPQLSWKTVPKYTQLRTTLELCWEHFLKRRESTHGVRTPSQLAAMSLQYYEGKSIKYLITRNIEFWRQQSLAEDEAIQKAIQLSLSVSRNWFEFKLPKWLIGISELQAYAFRKAHRGPGSYSFFAGRLENSFLKGILSVLMDYHVPASAIRKLEDLFSEQDDWASIENRIRTADLESLGLLLYEQKKLKSAIGV